MSEPLPQVFSLLDASGAGFGVWGSRRADKLRYKLISSSGSIRETHRDTNEQVNLLVCDFMAPLLPL
jgi:hypothetical protein